MLIVCKLMDSPYQKCRADALSERRKCIEDTINMWANALPLDHRYFKEDAERDKEALNRLLAEYEPHTSGETYFYI